MKIRLKKKKGTNSNQRNAKNLFGGVGFKLTTEEKERV